MIVTKQLNQYLKIAVLNKFQNQNLSNFQIETKKKKLKQQLLLVNQDKENLLFKTFQSQNSKIVKIIQWSFLALREVSLQQKVFNFMQQNIITKFWYFLIAKDLIILINQILCKIYKNQCVLFVGFQLLFYTYILIRDNLSILQIFQTQQTLWTIIILKQQIIQQKLLITAMVKQIRVTKKIIKILLKMYFNVNRLILILNLTINNTLVRQKMTKILINLFNKLNRFNNFVKNLNMKLHSKIAKPLKGNRTVKALRKCQYVAFKLQKKALKKM
ncbi:hypothetical protein TTHERM_000735439 (macronuclear) [Tetrahymena thermophila SB210]|uniref:Uncharacterized protein n=1 Tax=Tetrahymena thermophila (strain SB210) TaxID=312017 RepID=W7XDI3_TETTS|nr:hypothetical protein TTHERM_000735439 [Tetrahymena thermophila SB210]EWS75627.1 hypothetical protein TTHERM_000735439 [Tetrahymena thermophila SB210]|eukprot:XP_012651846.1 hypothetical protein TTHERM_000735439 [Tetrahymena thermophila SB210]